MKKNVLSIIITITMLLAMGQVPVIGAQSMDPLVGGEQKELTGECGENAIWKYNSETKTLTISGTGKIEWRIANKEIERNAKKLIVEDGIKIVGESVFNLFNLSEVILPNSLKEIEARAFCSCEIKKITIPKNVTKIGSSAFADCSELKEITILGNINSQTSFLGEGQNVKLNLAGFCGTIGIMSAYNSLSINFMPGNKKYIWKKGFIMSPNKKHLYLYTGIGKKKTNKTIAIPDTVEVIEPGAISWASNIKMGKNIKQIKSWGFYYCTFKTLKLPKNLKRIEDRAFSRADMDKIVINKKLKYIGKNAFDDTSLKKVVIDHYLILREGNFPNAKLKYTGKAKARTVIQNAYYWNRKTKKDKIRVDFLKVLGAKGYKIRIMQPGRGIDKTFDTRSKLVKTESEEDKVFGTKISAIVSRNFKVQKVKDKMFEEKYKRGYALYVKMRPYKYLNGKKKYGKWSNKMKLIIDDGFWFDAY